MQGYTKKIPIDELKDYGYVMVRNQPCKIAAAVKFQNDSKHGEAGKSKMRWDVIVNNLFTGEEVWKGLLKDELVEVPVVALVIYDVSFVSQTDANIELLDEDCEQVDGIELPVEDNIRLTKAIRKAFAEDLEVKVEVVEAFGRKMIVDF
jgi:translation elongation factor P/translation initiation factor 5A